MRRSLALLMVVVTAAACGPAEQPGTADNQAAAHRTKTLVLPVVNAFAGFANLTGNTNNGGLDSVDELHSNGLLTTGPSSRQVTGLLLEKVPSLNDGTIKILGDGQMQVVYLLRPDITWQDGAPFTSQDLAFTTRLLEDPGLPVPANLAQQMASVETPDDHTFVVTFKTVTSAAVNHSLKVFWPLPEHILGPVFQRYLGSHDPEDVLKEPYWTSEYVQLGPFRVTSFDPGEGIVLAAYDGYFRGRPKVDVIRVQVFLDTNTLFAALLAGTVDMFLQSILDVERGAQIEARWNQTGEGTVYTTPSNIRILVPQYRPAIQAEPANLDPRVRMALSLALDREELAAGLLNGHREAAAYGIVLPGDPLYEAGKDTVRSHTYDPQRAKSILQEVGWVAGPDGSLRNATDGRRFQTSIIGTQDFDRNIAVFAGYWRQLGIEVGQEQVAPPQARNAEYRAGFTGWEVTSTTYTVLVGPPASAQNRWVGNRDGYDDPSYDALVAAFQSALAEKEQLQAMKAISDYLGAVVGLVPVFYPFQYIGVRKGVKALEDHEGGMGQSLVGSFSRNAHLWDVD